MIDASAWESEPMASSGAATIAAGRAGSITKRVASFFEGRGISVETASRYGVYTHNPDQTGEAIAFGYLEGGVEVNTKYRGPNKKFWQRKDGKKTLWNVDVIGDASLSSGENALVITEGEMDALALIEAGYPFAVSVPDGAPPPKVPGADEADIEPDDDSKYEYIWNNWDRLKGIKRIVLATDADAPGRQLYSELTRRLGVERCLHVEYPEGCKDLNSALMEHGPEAVLAVISGAKPSPIKGLYTLCLLLSRLPDTRTLSPHAN